MTFLPPLYKENKLCRSLLYVAGRVVEALPPPILLLTAIFYTLPQRGGFFPRGDMRPNIGLVELRECGGEGERGIVSFALLHCRGH